jgi:UDP-GlcNAc:undecaprenyl-phosphate GlcNAc-1-phosphate transferase
MLGSLLNGNTIEGLAGLGLLGEGGLHAFTVDEVLSPYVYVFYASFIVAFLFTPAMRVVALQYGIIDQPDRTRKMHSVPVAYLGGIAVFLGLISGFAVSQFLRLHSSDPAEGVPVVMSFSIVVGACVIVILGLWDDIGGIKPITKIAGQVVAAIFLLMDDIGTRCMAPIIEPIGRMLSVKLGVPIPTPEWLIVAASSILVILVVVGCSNASNLIDGLDGLCGGVTAIIAAGLLFVAVHLAVNGGGLNSNWDGQRVVLGLALLGAILGFVPYNFNPASIFMGDTGSMLLGFCCAVMIILMGQGQHPKWFLASMVMFALPVLDTLLAFARRWVAKRPLFGADKYHFHHQLLSRGYTVKQTVIISYTLAIMFALLGGSIVLIRTRYAGGLWLMIFAWIIVAAYKMGMIHEKPRVVTRRDLSSRGLMPDAEELEPGKVIEVRDSKTPSVNTAGAEGNGMAWGEEKDKGPAAALLEQSAAPPAV